MAENNAAENYSVQAGHWQNEPVMILRDHKSGAVAMIAPDLGSNCVFWAIMHEGQEVQVIETPDSPEVLHNRPSRMGIPVLCPFPGRVRDARYEFKGQEYHLPRNDKSGIHSIHGVVLNARWQVAAQAVDDKGAHLLMLVRPDGVQADFRAGYPFDFALSIEFTLKDTRLIYDVTLENREATTEIPFSFGIHPYLRVPLITTAAAPDRTVCPVRVPAATHWPAPEGIPTGPAEPVSPEKDFREWKPLGSQPFDDMYSGVVFDGNQSSAGYRNPGTNLEVTVQADQHFHDWVLFTPPQRPSLAIEPYTSPPNAINMAAEGIAGSNLLTLAPGATWNAQIILEVKATK